MRQGIIFEPELREEHRYAVGVKIEGGGFTPLITYGTIEELEKAYSELFRAAKSSGHTLPIAVEKTDEGK